MPLSNAFPIVAFFAICMAPLANAGNYVAEMRERAHQGDREAQLVLAHLYEKGKGVKRDRTQARRWREASTRVVSRTGRYSPTRPEMDYSARVRPTRPMEPIRAERSYATRVNAVRSYPRRVDAARSYAATYESVRSTRRAFRGGRNPILVGGRIVLSPITFAVNQSRRVIMKAARKGAISRATEFY